MSYVFVDDIFQCTVVELWIDLFVFWCTMFLIPDRRLPSSDFILVFWIVVARRVDFGNTGKQYFATLISYIDYVIRFVL